MDGTIYLMVNRILSFVRFLEMATRMIEDGLLDLFNDQAVSDFIRFLNNNNFNQISSLICCFEKIQL